jgi:hypothetical protein
MSNIVIDIAAQFTGQKAFSKSEQAINKLGKTLKKAVIGVSITKVLTDSVKAFADGEKSAANLANTLQNLGLGTFTASVESSIDKMQLATGVLNDDLRPAFQTLVSSTGNAVKAQELLKLALDVSAGSGQDLASVSNDIAKVVTGNTKGLSKYALGLSKTEIALLSTNEALSILNGTFSGASEKASKTFAGSMLRIKAAVEAAKGSLGEGIVDALMTATGSANIEQLQQQIIDFGVSAGDAFRKLGTVIRENLGLLKTLAITFAAIWTAGKVIAGIEAVIKILDALNKTYKLLRATAVGTAIAQMAVLNPIGALAYGATLVAAITVSVRSLDLLTDKFNSTSDAADRLAAPRLYGGVYADKYLKEKEAFEKKQIADQLARDKAAIAAKEKAEKLAAANKKKLSQAAAVFEIQKIQIAAALKGKITEEEKTRLLLMQAIEEENADLAEELAKKLEQILDKNIKIAEALAAIGMTKDPFTTWASSLSLALIELGKYGKTMADISTTTFIPGVHYNPSQNADRNYDNKLDAVVGAITNEAAATIIADTTTNNLPIPSATATPVNTNPFAFLEGYADLYGFGSMGSMPTPAVTTINITVEGSVLNGDEFSEIVNDALINANKTGMPKTAAGFLID